MMEASEESKAIEIISKLPKTKESDIYSLGCIAFILMSNSIYIDLE